MTREDRIKAVEHCEAHARCKDCPLFEVDACDDIVNLTKEIEQLTEQLDTCKVMIALLERDIADRDEMLEKKVEEIYPEFMRDYRAMREELDGTYDELAELRERIRALIPYLATWLEVVENGKGYHFECSRCGAHWMLDASTYTCKKTPFCPQCGAKMEGMEGETTP